MNIYEIIELLKTKLEQQQKVLSVSDSLYEYNISADPYCELSKHVPLVLIEADKTEFINAEYGYPVAQDHHLSITLFESAQRSDFASYKKSVNDAVKSLIDMLMMIEDPRINRIVPSELSHAELHLDSLKVTGIVISIVVRTDWDDG